MGIRSLIAAAAMVVGIGQAAEAAGLHYVLQYEDTALENAWFSDNKGEEYHHSLISIHDTPLRLPTFHHGAVKGDIYKGYSLFRKGHVPSCHMGRIACSVSRWNNEAMVFPYGEITTDDFRVTWAWDWTGSGVDQIIVTNWGEWGGGVSIDTKDAFGFANAIITTFTIVDRYTTPSTVPLPASAALLPLGIGALAMMRRRRRT